MDSIITKDVISESTKLVPQIYEDLAQPAVQEIGNVAGRSAKALLAPIRGLLWGWDRIEEIITKEVEKKLESIPLINRKTPEPEIAVPLMQALTYTAQNNELREMFVNLLSNSMDISKEKMVHPSFTEIIKQMSSLDAILLKKLSDDLGYIKIVSPSIKISGTNKIFVSATPEWFLGWSIPNYDIFDVSSSLIRLRKFGLLELLLDQTAGRDGYETIKQSPLLTERLELYQANNLDKTLEISGIDSLCFINDCGKQFLNVCLN